MKTTGSRVVWAVRTKDTYLSLQTLIFRTKPVRKVFITYSGHPASFWSTTGDYYDSGTVYRFCGIFNKILKLPLNKPRKITLKVSVK